MDVLPTLMPIPMHILVPTQPLPPSERLADERAACGLAELDRWLADRVRIGLGNASDDAEATAFITSRLLAADLPWLARRVEEAEMRRAAGDVTGVIAEYGALHLLAASWERLAALPGPLRATVRCRTGLVVPFAAGPVEDLWQIVAAEAYGPLWVRGRTTGRFAKLDDVSAGGPRRAPKRVGQVFAAALAFHDEAVPYCAKVRGMEEGGTASVEPCREAPAGTTFAAALEQYRAAAAADPWTESFPTVVGGADPVPSDDGWLVADREGAVLPLLARSQATAVSALWRLAAAAAQGSPTVFGFLTAEGFVALTAWTADRAIRL